MTVYRLPPGAVLFTGADLDAVCYCIDVTQRARRRNGLPPSVALARLAALLSPAGQADMPDETPGEADYMSTDEAAAALGCSPRQARRLAPLLGGRLVGGRWLVDRLAIAEHIEGAVA